MQEDFVGKNIYLENFVIRNIYGVFLAKGECMINIVVIKSLIGILQILLLVLTISALIIFIIQFFRWLYGFLFAPKFRISI